MAIDYNYTPGQTPLEEDEKEGLKLKWVATKEQLNIVEQENIEDAILWTSSLSLKTEELLNEKFIKLLHKKMFGKVWKWAGEFRKTNKNLGVDKWVIPVELKKLFDDILYQIREEVYPPDEIVIRCKHRLVSIHCFPNGNGRHSRLMADVMIKQVYQMKEYSWGVKVKSPRAEYLNAVKQADRGEFAALIKFARS